MFTLLVKSDIRSLKQVKKTQLLQVNTKVCRPLKRKKPTHQLRQIDFRSKKDNLFYNNFFGNSTKVGNNLYKIETRTYILNFNTIRIQIKINLLTV